MCLLVCHIFHPRYVFNCRFNLLADGAQPFLYVQIVKISQPLARFAKSRKDNVPVGQLSGFIRIVQPGVDLFVDVVIRKEKVLAVGVLLIEVAGNFYHVARVYGHNNWPASCFADAFCSGIAFCIKNIFPVTQLAARDEKRSPCLAVFFKVFCTIRPDTLQCAEFTIRVIQGDNDIPVLIGFNAVGRIDLLCLMIRFGAGCIRHRVKLLHQPASC